MPHAASAALREVAGKARPSHSSATRSVSKSRAGGHSTNWGAGRSTPHAARCLERRRAGHDHACGHRGHAGYGDGDYPLPQPFDPHDPDKGLRRLSAKAERAEPAEWLIASSALSRALISFIVANNTTGIAIAYDGLMTLGWGETIMGLAQRIERRAGIEPAARRFRPAVARRPPPTGGAAPARKT